MLPFCPLFGSSTVLTVIAMPIQPEHTIMHSSAEGSHLWCFDYFIIWFVKLDKFHIETTASYNLVSQSKCYTFCLLKE